MSSQSYATENNNNKNNQLLLWERVDATSFVHEAYDKYLAMGKKLKLQQERAQEQQEEPS